MEVENYKKVVPASEQFLTVEDLTDEDNEIVFVQHPEGIDVQLLKSAVFNFKERAKVDVVNMRNTNVYPLAFDGEGLTVSRSVDRYVVVCTKEKL